MFSYLYVSGNGEESHENLLVFLQSADLTHRSYDQQYPWNVAVVLPQNYRIVADERKEGDGVRERGRG